MVPYGGLRGREVHEKIINRDSGLYRINLK